MKNKFLLLTVFFISLIFINAHASTSSEVYNNSYMKMYSSKYPALNPSYQEDEGEGYVDATHGSLLTHTEDYRINGKNGFDVPFIRSYSSHTSGGEIYYKEYSSKYDAPKYYYTRYICSEDNSGVLIYFKNEKEAFEARSSFVGIMYDENDENMYDYLTSGSGTITYTRDEEYGLKISEYETYTPVRYIRAVDEDAFVPFDNAMQILKPSIFCYDYLIDGNYLYANIIFQDLNGKACTLDLEYRRYGSPNKFVGCEKGKYTAYSEYEMTSVDNDDISVKATHPAGFKYNMTLVSDSGVTYYVMRNTYQTYDVLGVSDKYGNTYLFKMTDTSYSVTTPEGDVYVCSVNGITKKSNGEVTQLVSYINEVINSEEDINDEFKIDDEYIFAITKNSGTSLNISESEKNVTKYYFKKELLYENLADTPWLPAYSLAYKIEFPTGLTKHLEYTEQKNWYMGLPGDKLPGNYFFVSRYYETDGTTIKHESTYTYESKNTPISKTGENHYIYESAQNEMKNGSVAKKIYESYDYMSRLIKKEVDASSQQGNTYEYEYIGSNPDSKVSKILIEEYQSAVSAYHEKSYTYSGNYLKSETDGEYNINYTYGSNYIPTEIIYQKDANTTVKTENILTEDEKSIAQKNIYKNNVLEQTINYTYDAYGNISSETFDAESDNPKVTNYNYSYANDGGYTLTTTQSGIKDADDQDLSDIVTITVFDYNHKPVSYIDANGNITTMTYDMLGRLRTIAYPDGTSESYSYDIENNITTFIAKNGTVYKTYFDAWGNKSKTCAVMNGKENIFEEFLYDNFNNISTYKKYSNAYNYARATYQYDYLNRPVYESIYNGTSYVKSTTYTYTLENDSQNRPLATVTATISPSSSSFAKYSITTDYRGNIIQEKYFTDSQTRTYTYTNDYLGNVLTSTNPAGRTTSVVYNVLNNPTQITYADNSTESFNYNALGLLTEKTDKMGNTTEYVYDNAGRLIKTISPIDENNNSLSKTYYDANGNITKTAAKRFAEYDSYDKAEYAYDSMNRVLYSVAYVTGRNKIYTCYEYDALGNPSKVTTGKLGLTDTGNGRSIDYSYDALGRLTALTTPDGESETYTYDLQGRKLTSTSKSGVVTSYTYNVFDDIVSKRAGNEVVTFTYNINGNRTSMTDSTGTTNYTYSPFGELTQETKGDIVKSYTYDNLSNRTAFSVTNAGSSLMSHTYVYDSMNRLTRVLGAEGLVYYTYDANSNQLTSTLNGKAYRNITYNKANLPVTAQYYNQSGVNTDTITYEYRLNGLLTDKVHTDIQNNVTTDTYYDYDMSGRLTYEQTHVNEWGYDYEYAYDNYGNRTLKSYWDFDDGNNIIDTTYTYNNINQLVSDSNGNTYTYDEDGNMTSVVQNGETVKSYVYDSFNRLIESTVNGVTTQYTYDGDNLRQTKTTDGVQTMHIYDGMNIVADIGEETKVYFRGTDLIRQRNISTNTLQTYFTEQRNDVFKISNTNGTNKCYRYLGYGDTTESGAEISNPFGYCGEYQDLCSGLIYLRNRYYDPSIGRFITQDPARDGLNWYVYANNNPLKYIDPSGLRSKEAADKITKDNATYIISAAEEFGVNPGILAATIYAEQRLNVDWKDDYIDGIVGFYGVDTSIGIGQLRISTAKFIEKEGYMPTLSAKDGGWNIPLIGFVHGTEQMVREKTLENSELNIKYAAGYLKYFQDEWKNVYPDIDGKTDILATLYNLGHEQTSPNSNPKPNDFGKFAKENYSHVRKLLGLE